MILFEKITSERQHSSLLVWGKLLFEEVIMCITCTFEDLSGTIDWLTKEWMQILLEKVLRNVTKLWNREDFVRIADFRRASEIDDSMYGSYTDR